MKNTDSAEQKGYDAGKKISGIKRHIAVDTQGLPHALTVTTADVTDREGALRAMDRSKPNLELVESILVDGQIEIDEVYVALDRQGVQYVIPVQAKGGKDHLAVVQTNQDLACCAVKFPSLVCRSVSAQFIDMEDKKKKIAMFELALEEDRVVIVEEKHYRLVASAEISSEELKAYRNK